MFSDDKNNNIVWKRDCTPPHPQYILKTIFQGELLNQAWFFPPRGLQRRWMSKPLRLWPDSVVVPPAHWDCLRPAISCRWSQLPESSFSPDFSDQSVEGQAENGESSPGVRFYVYNGIALDWLGPEHSVWAQAEAIPLRESHSLSECLFYRLWKNSWFDYL